MTLNSSLISACIVLFSCLLKSLNCPLIFLKITFVYEVNAVHCFLSQSFQKTLICMFCWILQTTPGKWKQRSLLSLHWLLFFKNNNIVLICPE